MDTRPSQEPPPQKSPPGTRDGLLIARHCLDGSGTLSHGDRDLHFGGGTESLKWLDKDRSVPKRKKACPGCILSLRLSRSSCHAAPALTKIWPNPRRSKGDTDGQSSPASPQGPGLLILPQGFGVRSGSCNG